MPEITNTESLNNEMPSNYADRLGAIYSQKVSKKHKKDNGQFFTPMPIASLMASFCDFCADSITILDPGCGTAILTCTVLEHLTSINPDLKNVKLLAYETDSELICFSEKALVYLQKWLLDKNIHFEYELKTTDFVLDNSDILRDTKKQDKKFDLIISNPPYFKLSKNDVKTIAAKELISGQPNIYSIFMGIASKMLKKNGELIFITPRSFASGNYFRAFRELFFNTVQLDIIHLFNSRKDTFKRDSVLQETVIIKAINCTIDPNKEVRVFSSIGINDIYTPNMKTFISHELINLDSPGKILHLPTSDKEESVLNLVSSWGNNLIDYNIHISTGPVVSFRSWDFIQDNYEIENTFLAPLFWLHNVNKMYLQWPIPLKNKGQFINVNVKSRSLLIPNKDYVLLRRFSTKEDKSRLIAAPYFSNYTIADFIGVENKVNYIYRKKGYLTRSEVTGLCSLLNSELFDIYFQIFNGNVNVSATELREMRFPPIENINEIGNIVILSNDYSMNNVNQIVNEYFTLNDVLN